MNNAIHIFWIFAGIMALTILLREQHYREERAKRRKADGDD